MDKEWKKKFKFFKTVPGILLTIAAILAVVIAVLLISNRIGNIREEKQILAELQHKNYKDITFKDFRILYEKSETIDSAGELDKFVESGHVAWMVTQGHGKDAGSLKIVGRLSPDIVGKARFFKTTPRTVAVTGLEGWADRLNTKANNLPADPEPPSQGIWSHIKSGPGILALGILLIFALGFLWFFLWGPMSGLNRFARGRELTPEKNDKRFCDIAGADAAIFEAKEAVEILQNIKEELEQKKEAKKSRDPSNNSDDDDDTSPDMIKGLLLIGPPGTGKTLLAMAIAGEAKVPFFQMNGSDFVEMFVGVGPKRVRTLFATAKKNAPSIVFIDEIDAVAKKRQPDIGFGGDSEYSNTVNALLVEIDGFDKGIPVLIIGATNRPEILDDALLRPGRFTRQITMDLPDKEGRKAILELHIKKLKRIMADDISLETLAHETPGFSGDSLRNLVNEANILAVRRKRKGGGRKVIKKEDFEDAFDRVIYGLEKDSRITPGEKELFAFHEAGHALVGYKVEKETGDVIHKATIVQRGHTGGHTQPLWKDSKVLQKSQAEGRMTMYAGGYAAEEARYNGDISTGASSDLDQVKSLARNMVKKWGMGDIEKLGFGNFPDAETPGGVGLSATESAETRNLIDEEVRGLTLKAITRARKILDEDNRKKLFYLAEKLTEAETISGDALREILENPVPENWRGQNEKR